MQLYDLSEAKSEQITHNVILNECIDKKSLIKTKCFCGNLNSESAKFPKLWNEFRLKNIVCDGIIISSDGQAFPVHRAIVSAYVSLIKVLFVNDSSVGKLEKTKIHIRIPGDTLSLILDFIYTGKCNITFNNVEKILLAANQYGIEDLLHTCCTFIVNGMSPQNCLNVFKLASPFFCETLKSKAFQFICHNFCDMYKNWDVWLLSSTELLDILSDDQLRVRNETEIFQTIISWADNNPNRRLKDLEKLVTYCPRYGLIELKYITDVVMKNKYVSESEELQRNLQLILEYLQKPNAKLELQARINPSISRPRIPYEILFAIGGWSNGGATNYMETYDVRADRWFPSSDTDESPRAYHGMCVLDNVIYLIGGFNGTDHFNTVKTYNPITHQWADRACMYYARCYVSVCTLGGQIYALGGYDGRTRLCSAERYSPKENQWEKIPDMICRRSDASATTMDNKIYVAGGFNGDEVLDSVEMFDISTNKWTFIQSMNNARSGVSLVAHKKCLYALGGFNGYSRLNTGESFDPENSYAWTAIAEMFISRSNFGVAILDDLIYVIGGFNELITGTTTVPYVECYDANLNEWYDAAEMNLNRSALAACVVAGLPNAREYSYISKIQDINQIVNADTSETCH